MPTTAWKIWRPSSNQKSVHGCSARGRFIISVLSNFDDLGPAAKGTVDWATFALHGSLFDRSAFSMASSWKLDWDTLPAKIQQELSRDDLARARRRSAFLQVEDTA